MKTATGTPARRAWRRTVVVGLFIVGAVTIPLTTMQSQQPTLGYIQGTVRSSAGPEAGVWVIAETKDLRPISSRSSSPTIRAVTCCPTCRGELQRLGPRLWPGRLEARHGQAEHGNNAPALNLTAIVAKDKVEAAKVYPGDYWMSDAGTACQRAHSRSEPGNAAEPRRLDARLQIELQLLPSAWQPDYAHAGSCLQGKARTQDLRKPGTIACRPVFAVADERRRHWPESAVSP